MMLRTALLLFFLAQAPALAQPPPFTLQWVHGRCVGCRLVFQLGRLQVLSDAEAWATGTQVGISGGHVSQSSSVLHTSDGGRTWKRLKDVETYGVDVEPAFWFLDARRGWVAWPTSWDAEEHLVRTLDGGRRWKKLPGNLEGSWVHLRFFDRRLGCAALSTAQGALFATTRDGGATWVLERTELTYPDVLSFLNPTLGWLGGSSAEGSRQIPRLLRTTDGGRTWRGASFPDKVQGNPHDLFFLDALHGWLVLWNTDDLGSALLQTADGGRTWIRSPESSFQGRDRYLGAVRFVSAQVGFALMEEKRRDAPEGSPGKAALFSTRDGGQSWKRFPLPTAARSCQVVHGEVWCSSGMSLLKIRPNP
ncbi:MAG TPA: hypothetical protein VOA87_19105 [Thermoanaerobaculia bacterium]|nr:hypothetical protein [Thermoanaerobaculia bacterium]